MKGLRNWVFTNTVCGELRINSLEWTSDKLGSAVNLNHTFLGPPCTHKSKVELAVVVALTWDSSTEDVEVEGWRVSC